ncbi:MAG: hypothetical protein ACE5JH_05210 [Acidobacteriota bacterium]
MDTLSSRTGTVLLGLTCAALVCACSGTSGGREAPAEPAAVTESTPATEDGTAESAEPAAAADRKAEAAAQNPEPFEPSRAAGAVVGVPAATNTAPIVAVANYYADLPGFDLSKLSRRQREKFLQRVNSEMCTCGCKNDTLARCHVNDPNCPAVKGLIQQVYDEVRSGA